MNSSKIGYFQNKMNSDLLEVVKPLADQRQEFFQKIRIKNLESGIEVNYLDGNNWLQTSKTNQANGSNNVINYLV